MIPLVTIEGPTASGKTSLALKLAAELGSGIISADSRQVYRFMDIGTAKPGQEELQEIPHHLIDIIDPDESYNAGRFCADAGAIIRGLKGRLPIVCGGTGLYVSALLNGIFPQMEIPARIRRELKERIKSEGVEVLHEELKSVDPAFAAKISKRDRQRICRGLEVWQATGIPISEHWQKQAPRQDYSAFRILIDPPRDILYERINKRTLDMLDRGLIAEIQKLFELGYDEASPGLNSLGYKEFVPHLKEGRPLGECALLAAQHTRNYAKRQRTWYRKHKFDLTLASNECIISDVTGLINTRFKRK